VDNFVDSCLPEAAKPCKAGVFLHGKKKWRFDFFL